MRVTAVQEVYPGRHLAMLADVFRGITAYRTAMHAEGHEAGAGREADGAALGGIGFDAVLIASRRGLVEVDFFFIAGLSFARRVGQRPHEGDKPSHRGPAKDRVDGKDRADVS